MLIRVILACSQLQKHSNFIIRSMLDSFQPRLMKHIKYSSEQLYILHIQKQHIRATQNTQCFGCHKRRSRSTTVSMPHGANKSSLFHKHTFSPTTPTVDPCPHHYLLVCRATRQAHASSHNILLDSSPPQQ